MANFTKVDNDFVEMISSARISATAHQVVWTILRKTNGFGKREDWISLSQFESATGKTRRAIVDAVDQLVQKTILVKKTTLGKRSMYRLKTPLVKKTTLVKKPAPVQKTSKTSEENFTQLVKKTTPTKETIQKKNKQKKSDVDVLFDFYVKQTGSKEKLSKARKAKMTTRLKEFSLEECKRAVLAAVNDSFYSGDNDRGWKANLDYIFRSFENTEKLSIIGEKYVEQEKATNDPLLKGSLDRAREERAGK